MENTQDSYSPTIPPFAASKGLTTAWQRECLGQWEDTLWQKPGACCNYTHRSTKMELPARILNIEYAHGRGRAWCEIVDVTGRLRNRWMDLSELHQSPND